LVTLSQSPPWAMSTGFPPGGILETYKSIIFIHLYFTLDEHFRSTNDNQTVFGTKILRLLQKLRPEARAALTNTAPDVPHAISSIHFQSMPPQPFSTFPARQQNSASSHCR
jgi:hypothetical protein